MCDKETKQLFIKQDEKIDKILNYLHNHSVAIAEVNKDLKSNTDDHKDIKESFKDIDTRLKATESFVQSSKTGLAIIVWVIGLSSLATLKMLFGS